LERCKNSRLLNPESPSIFEEAEEDYRKRRSENTVFKHDHLRTWELTNALSPSKNSQRLAETTPKVNRRYMEGGVAARDALEGRTTAIRPYNRYAKENEGAHPQSIFEDTVVFIKDSKKPAGKRAKPPPNYM
jgi:hypothetical protein